MDKATRLVEDASKKFLCEAMLATKEEQVAILTDQVQAQQNDFNELVLNSREQYDQQLLIAWELDNINKQCEEEYNRLRKKVNRRNVLSYGLAAALLVSLGLNLAQ